MPEKIWGWLGSELVEYTAGQGDAYERLGIIAGDPKPSEQSMRKVALADEMAGVLREVGEYLDDVEDDGVDIADPLFPLVIAVRTVLSRLDRAASEAAGVTVSDDDGEVD